MRQRGSVTEHHDRDGRIRHRVRLTVQGKRRSLGIYDTKEEAEAVLDAAIEQIGDDGFALTLAGWGERWLNQRETDKLHRSIRSTRSVWTSRVATAPFALWPMHSIKRTDVVRWVRSLLRSTAKPGHKHKTTPKRRLARQSVSNALVLLRRCLSDAADEGHIPSNPADGVRVPRVPTTEEGWTYLDEDEIAALLAKLTPAQRTIFTVAIYTGLRAGELWGLRWGDVILKGKRPELVVRHSYRGPTKGGRVRRVPLLGQALVALKAWKKEKPGVAHALVWPADGGGCHAEGYTAGLQAALARAGITRRVRFHDLRHTCASHLVMGSWTRTAWRLEDVRQMLGHRSIVTTERYAHLAPDAIHGLVADTKRTPLDDAPSTKNE